jgi:hypothetical protein
VPLTDDYDRAENIDYYLDLYRVVSTYYIIFIVRALFSKNIYTVTLYCLFLLGQLFLFMAALFLS